MRRPGQFKMVLLGESAVGKSSLALRFAKGQYQEHAESTIGAAFLTHTLQIDQDTSLKVELWDTAGQERYHSLAPMYYRGAQAALVVYDITNGESLRRAKQWVKELQQVNANDMVIGLAGNKADLATGNRRQVDSNEVREYAEQNDLIFMETSAKRDKCNRNGASYKISRYIKIFNRSGTRVKDVERTRIYSSSSSTNSGASPRK
ncbi:unnamed protein product [Adineta steineri]|uniref:Uncharacterized protein n=1 Tax=Adineta steineri TaxID=433720 RepID=A0A814HD00_9BILA|nr:unnamed protein product [Adineta steineri]